MIAGTAVYNSLIPAMRICLIRVPRPVCRFGLLILFLFFSLSAVSASDWNAAEQQLAQKIAAATGPGAMALEITNRSSLSKKDFDEIGSGLKSQLNALGIQFAKAEQATMSAQITFSENLRQYVWVAEIRQGAAQSTVMVSLPRAEPSMYVHQTAPLTLRKIPLWSQEQRILDLVSLDVNGVPLHLVVLSPEQLDIYRFQDGRWLQDQSLPIVHARAWPRDMRGRLVLSKDHMFDVYLPGVFCQSTATPPLAISCRESDDPWPLGSANVSLSAFFSPTRNFFTGVLVPGIGKQTTAPRFFNAAPMPREKYTLWLLSGLDGQLHLLDGITDQAGKLGWGSELASVKTGCGAGWQALAVRSGDFGSDSLRAFEFPDRDPVPVSQAVEFNGAITALWPEPGGSTAIAVAQNSETGKYEAFRLAIACGH
ncbi:MAG TPA: hypothetical protein VFJ47_04210 [Terriglobales bacterium]|nr:hypothetical protein [Terriglobales bacterium]